MKRLVVSDAAHADLRSIAVYSEREWGAMRRKQYLAAIRERFGLLRHRPETGVMRQDVAAVTWQAFWRTFIDQQPARQVAADLGQTVAAVYLARRRVLTRLREYVRQLQAE